MSPNFGSNSFLQLKICEAQRKKTKSTNVCAVTLVPCITQNLILLVGGKRQTDSHKYKNALHRKYPEIPWHDEFNNFPF